MSKQPYIRSLSISHFRAIRDVKFEHLRRISLFGGLNGVGKSTILDSIFQFVDMGNPALLFRSAQFKQLPVSLRDIHRINEGQYPDRPSIHKFRTRDGNYEVIWKWGPQNLGVTSSVTISTNTELPSQAGNYQDGYSLTVNKDSSLALSRRFIDDGNNSLTFNQEFGTDLRFPGSVYLSRQTINSAINIANRYTQIVQHGLKRRLLEIINSISIKFDDLELLQPGGQSVIHLAVKDVLIPLQFAGDGIATIVAVVLAIMTSPGGIVILDEFDASVHYSVLKDTWKLFHTLCVEFDVQIFAATHSRECATALFESIDANSKNDVVYYRIDLVNDQNIVTRYQWEEMREAQAEGWEFR